MRSQVAMAVLAASSVFHALATAGSGWESVLPVAILAGLCDYVVNVTLVSGAVAIAYEISYVESLRRMRIGRDPGRVGVLGLRHRIGRHRSTVQPVHDGIKERRQLPHLLCQFLLALLQPVDPPRLGLKRGGRWTLGSGMYGAARGLVHTCPPLCLLLP